MSDAPRNGPLDAGSVTLAAELALRLLSPEEQADAEARMARDPAFAREVAYWQGQFATLGETAEAVAPPANLWQAIEARIGRTTPARRETTVLRGLWDNLPFWRWSAIASAAAALIAIVALAALPTGPAQAPLVATLQAKDGGTFVVFVEGGQENLSARPVGFQDTGQRVPELWVVPDGGSPMSLGVISGTDPKRYRLPAGVRSHIRAGATFAISLEPEGGSPTGQPTGPVIAAGKLQSL